MQLPTYCYTSIPLSLNKKLNSDQSLAFLRLWLDQSEHRMQPARGWVGELVVLSRQHGSSNTLWNIPNICIFKEPLQEIFALPKKATLIVQCFLGIIILESLMQLYDNYLAIHCFLAIMWQSFGNYLTIIWQLFGNYLAIIWQLFGNHLAIIWPTFESLLPIFQANVR